MSDSHRRVLARVRRAAPLHAGRINDSGQDFRPVSHGTRGQRPQRRARAADAGSRTRQPRDGRLPLGRSKSEKASPLFSGGTEVTTVAPASRDTPLDRTAAPRKRFFLRSMARSPWTVSSEIGLGPSVVSRNTRPHRDRRRAREDGFERRAPPVKPRAAARERGGSDDRNYDWDCP
jgi:hypothetical protein